MKRKTLLLDLINKSIRNEKFDLAELEIMDFASRALSNIGKPPKPGGRSIPIPLGSEPEMEDFWLRHNKRAHETEQYLIASEQNYIINPITEKSVFTQAGALYWPIQHNDIVASSFSGILASWADAGEDPVSDGDEITISGVRFSGKRMYECLDVPAKLILQGGPASEQWLKDHITADLAAKVDATLGGIAASDTKKPQGMGYTITTGNTTSKLTIVPTYDDLVALEKSVDGLNVPISNYGFITNPAGRRILRGVSSRGVSTVDMEPVYKNGKIIDYPAYISNLISGAAGSDGLGNLLLYGNWQDLAIVQFGAYDITVDPYTLKKVGKIQLHINAYFDFKGLRGSSPTGANEITEDNQYAFSFGALSIKEAE